MRFFGFGKKKEPVRSVPSQPEAHTVYGTGLNEAEALSAVRRNLPPNARETGSRTYPFTGPPIKAEVTYRLNPVPQPARGHGAAAPTPSQEILYRRE